MKKRGFTMVEILASIAIIAIVAAILTPAFRAVKHSAQVTASISNLHQMWVALALYQSSYGSNGSYSSPASIGLPTENPALPGSGFALAGTGFALGNYNKIWQSPCGLNPSYFSGILSVQYDYFPIATHDKFAIIGPLYQENLTVFDDMNCAEHGEPLYSDYIPHRGLGVLLSGALLNLNRTGDSRYQKWWSKPVTN